MLINWLIDTVPGDGAFGRSTQMWKHIVARGINFAVDVVSYLNGVVGVRP
jgi:hypothetical protein